MIHWFLNVGQVTFDWWCDHFVWVLWGAIAVHFLMCWIDEKKKPPSWLKTVFNYTYLGIGLPFIVALFTFPIMIVVLWFGCAWYLITTPSPPLINFIGSAAVFVIVPVAAYDYFRNKGRIKIAPDHSEFGDRRVATVDETYEAGL